MVSNVFSHITRLRVQIYLKFKLNFVENCIKCKMQAMSWRNLPYLLQKLQNYEKCATSTSAERLRHVYLLIWKKNKNHFLILIVLLFYLYIKYIIACMMYWLTLHMLCCLSPSLLFFINTCMHV